MSGFRLAQLFSRKTSPDAKRPFAFFRAGNAENQKKPILAFEGVYKYFKADAPTLRDVSFEIERGEFVFVTGPSGAGKSTLLQMIYRKQVVDEGRVLFCGKDIARLTAPSIPFLRRNLGVVFQDFKVVPHWTVYENVAVPLEILSMPARLVRSRVAEALERVGLRGRGEDRVAGLSGGEQQRVAVARAIVTEPALLLADEPTGNLDPTLALDILTLLEEIHKSGTTVVFATHDHSLIEQRNHRVLVLDQGRIFEAEYGLTGVKLVDGGGTKAPVRVEQHVPMTAPIANANSARVAEEPSWEILDRRRRERPVAPMSTPSRLIPAIQRASDTLPMSASAPSPILPSALKQAAVRDDQFYSLDAENTLELEFELALRSQMGGTKENVEDEMPASSAVTRRSEIVSKEASIGARRTGTY